MLLFTKVKLKTLYKEVQNTRQPLVKYDLCHVRLPDLRSLLPLQYLEHSSEDDLRALPWLTDEVSIGFVGILIQVKISFNICIYGHRLETAGLPS